MSSKNILLVEGEADRSFFEVICRQLAIDASIHVAAPNDLIASQVFKNTKEGVFSLLPELLKQLEDGTTEKLAVVVDADSLVNGGGFQKACDRVGRIVQPAGFDLAPGKSADGLVFENSDGLADLGLWVMPNNADEGMLEDWIKQCLHPGEDALYQHAGTSIDAIPGGPKFKPLHRTKAEVATWLAWQEKPGHGLYNAAKPDLLNTSAPLFAGLHAWLTHVFAA